MNIINRETLFEEHRRRFYTLPLQEDPRQDIVAEAFFWNDQMAWSLGIIPWHAWRYPFQKAMLQYLETHCPQEAERLYDAVNNALATAHGDYFSLPTEQDRKNLIDTIRTFCSEKIAEHNVRLIHSVKPNPPFLGISALEIFLQHISKKRKHERHAQYVACLSYLLHFRILNEFFRQLTPLVTEIDTKTKDIIALLTFDILFSISLEAPHFFTEKRVKADPRKMSPEIFNFWTWQYTYRNKEYQKLRTPLEKFFRQSDIVFVNISVQNHKEYQTAYRRLCGEFDIFGMMFPEYDAAMDAITEKFDCYPSWPISDYTSDFILERMLSGKFRYWERETPPTFISKEAKFHLCLRNAALCTNEHRVTQPVTDGKRHFEVCAPECIVAMKEQEQNIYQETVNEERSRIRPEAIHRMIGLWLWDYCQGHNAKPAAAMRALKKKHFPENNPGWSVLRPSEVEKSTDWYDYREKTTATPTLYADYQDACRCIEAAKFLPRQRGVKKETNVHICKEKKKK